MSVKTERVEARLSPEQRGRIEQAAEYAGESMSASMVSAAVERADELIAAALELATYATATLDDQRARPRSDRSATSTVPSDRS